MDTDDSQNKEILFNEDIPVRKPLSSDVDEKRKKMKCAWPTLHGWTDAAVASKGTHSNANACESAAAREEYFFRGAFNRLH